MNKITLMFEFCEHQGRLVPNWLVVELPNTQNIWNTLLHIGIDGHSDYSDPDDSDVEMSLIVPYSCYVFQVDKPRSIGIHMPLLLNHVLEIGKIDNTIIDHLDIRRLHLRISDVEEIMQTRIRYHDKNF